MFTTQSTSARLVEMMPWVELSDGVEYLQGLLGPSINQDDVLRLAMEGHLTLSVRFLSGVTVQPGKAVPFTQEMVEQVPTLDGDGVFLIVSGTPLPGGDQVIRYEDRVATISDVWDLPMIGGEKLVVEDLYERMQLREAPEFLDLEGTFVSDGAGNYFKLMERFGPEHQRKGLKPDDIANFYPAAGLPDDAVLVLRPARLREFAAKFALSEPAKAPQQKPLGNRERTTLLTIIAALAKLANVPVQRPSKAAAIIETQTELMGARIAARTIENHLRAIADLNYPSID